MPSFGSSSSNSGSKAGMPTNIPTSPVSSGSMKAIDTVVDEVIRGEWGNGADRKAKLEAAGYSYEVIQNKVNRKLGAVGTAGLEDVAKAVIRGEYGNGAERKQRLEAAGYNFDQVQARVNALLK